MKSYKNGIILGFGGHSKMLLSLIDWSIYKNCIISLPKPETLNIPYPTITDSDLKMISDYKHTSLLFNGLGFLPGSSRRADLFHTFNQLGYKFGKVIANSAEISERVKIAESAQIFPNACVNNGAEIGQNTIINTGSIIEHDVIVGKHCHIAPGSIICGHVKIGNNCFIGAGSILREGITLQDNTVLPMGEKVYKSR